MNKLKPQHEDYNLVLLAWKMLSNWLIMSVSSSASCHMPAYKAAIYIYNLEPLNVTVMSWMLTEVTKYSHNIVKLLARTQHNYNKYHYKIISRQSRQSGTVYSISFSFREKDWVICLSSVGVKRRMINLWLLSLPIICLLNMIESNA